MPITTDAFEVNVSRPFDRLLEVVGDEFRLANDEIIVGASEASLKRMGRIVIAMKAIGMFGEKILEASLKQIPTEDSASLMNGMNSAAKDLAKDACAKIGIVEP